MQSDRVLKKFRSRFCGKCSPVHFFWGSFDLAVTRFSGRLRRRIPAASRIFPTRDARSLRAGSSSVGFWPGNAASPTPLYYSYAYPEPPGFAQAKVRPAEASYYAPLQEFVLAL